MGKPYVLLADVHLHAWKTFSGTDVRGVNTRLEGLLSEIWRAHKEVQKLGGNKMVIAGDLFHVRGSVAPSVLNPTLDLFRNIVGEGTDVTIIAGNHDLEGKESNRLGSAITALEGVGCEIINRPEGTFGQNMVLIPWIEDIDKLKEKIWEASSMLVVEKLEETDLILHAPIDGVITGLPDHGLTAEFLESVGFCRVFAGHYHNHKQFEATSVYSIGALAHHTWSDVGSKAGFLIVTDEKVVWRKSRLPEFIDINESTSEEDIPLLVEGNFVRMKVSGEVTTREHETVRADLEKMGAKGMIINVLRKPVLEREGDVTEKITAGASLEQSVSEFVKQKLLDPKLESAVTKVALEILAKAGEPE